jgi:hypothetical protein
MRLVQFEYKKVPGSELVWYPDDKSLFSKSYISGDLHIAEYTGDLPLDDASIIPDFSPATPPPRKLSNYAFMQLVGDANMVGILVAAKTNPVVELLVEKLKQADYVDFDDERGGPAAGMAYLLSIELLTQEEHDRIMRVEFPQ